MKLRHFRLNRFFIQLLSYLRKHWLIISLLVIFFFGTLGIRRGLSTIKQLQIQPQDLLGFFGKPKAQLASTNDITNILLLGIRGEGQDSPDLSDTIIILSYHYDSKTPYLVSIPRDLWIPSLKSKINAAYHYGEEASPGGGISMAQAAILESTGLPINYTAVVNFSIFKEVIDLVGGVDIDVQPGFTDSEFPIPGKENVLPESSRYETVTFSTGQQHFDGETALKYVRSRHATGDEGTDFARSRRQQQIISALKPKLLSTSFLLDQAKVNAFMQIINKNLKTNLSPDLYPALARLALDAKDNPIKNITFSNQPDAGGVAILMNPPIKNYDGQWVLIPKDNNYAALKQYIANLMK